jgi:hypothetical protein
MCPLIKWLSRFWDKHTAVNKCSITSYMRMKNRIITICAILTCLIGLNQRNREGLILGLDNHGLPYYPMSLGSNDGFILAIGFLSFVFTVLYSLGAFSFKRTPKRLNIAYCLNLLFLVFCVFLVELDSSIINSALYGDIVPVIGLITAFFPALILTVLHITAHSTGDAISKPTTHG